MPFIARGSRLLGREGRVRVDEVSVIVGIQI
jgi:hypothetical protein